MELQQLEEAFRTTQSRISLIKLKIKEQQGIVDQFKFVETIFATTIPPEKKAQISEQLTQLTKLADESEAQLVAIKEKIAYTTGRLSVVESITVH